MTKIINRLILLALFGFIVVAAPQLIGEQGYVLIALGNWTLEGSVVSFTISIIIASLALYLLAKIAKMLFMVFIYPSKWWQKHHSKIHGNYFQTGLNLMALGQWQAAADQFLKVKRSDRLEVARELSLVCAAHANDNVLSTKVQTQLALPVITDESKKNDLNELKVEFAQLVLLTKQGDYKQAQSILNKLNLPIIKQSLAMQMVWLEICVNTHNWTELNKQLSKLDKQINKNYPTDVFQQWHQTVQTLLTLGFKQFVEQHSVNKLQQVWQTMSKTTQAIRPVSSAYIECLATQQQESMIELILIEQGDKLGHDWTLQQIRTYFSYNTHVHMDRLFNKIQKQASKQPDNKQLITIMAYLAAGQKDHQLAKQALEQVVYSNKQPLDTKLYALVLAELGESRRSIDVFKSL